MLKSNPVGRTENMKTRFQIVLSTAKVCYGLTNTRKVIMNVLYSLYHVISSETHKHLQSYILLAPVK